MQHLGNEQLLLRGLAAKKPLHAFIDDALMRGMHIHQHHALIGLRQNVDTMQLRDGIA